MSEPLKDGVRVRIELTPENSAVEEPCMYWATILMHIPPSPPAFPEYDYHVEVFVQGERWVGWIGEGRILEVADV